MLTVRSEIGPFHHGAISRWQNNVSPVSREVITRQMKKDGRGETERIDSIHDSAVTGDAYAVIFHSAVALDSRHD